MTVLEYVARFTELDRFADDYVATDAVHSRQDCRAPPIGHGLYG